LIGCVGAVLLAISSNFYRTAVTSLTPFINAVDLSSIVGLFVAAFGFAREFGTWAGTIFSPGDLRQTMHGEFLALSQSVGYQETVQIPGHCHQR
jgi:hypothetical protein